MQKIHEQPNPDVIKPSTSSPELSVIVPIFNEKDNIAELVNRLKLVLKDIHWEVIFIDDDSPDGSYEVIEKLAKDDRRIRCVCRIGRRGLSSACIEGFLSSTSPFLAVMDGDLQHDEEVLPVMLEALKSKQFDIVVGSRYSSGGSCGNWNSLRKSISRFATFISQLLLNIQLKDPMSGFFVVRREIVQGVVRDLSGVGYKILLDIFTSSKRDLNFEEIPYEFRSREKGESKLDSHVLWDYLILHLDKVFKGVVPVRFLSFALIGLFGVLIHFSILSFLHKALAFPFAIGQTAATLTAILANFTFNNLLTYSDRRLRGWRWFKGLASFYIVCSLGAIANIATSAYLFELNINWVLSAMCGIVIGAVWNYSLSAFYTWDK